MADSREPSQVGVMEVVTSGLAGSRAKNYRGWGHLMGDPAFLRERVSAEQEHNALVAALFLTMSVPWFCDPPSHVAEDEVFAVLALLGMTCQFLSLMFSLCILAHVNKLRGDRLVAFIQALWPDGFAGHFNAGNLAFVFGNLSWIMTLVAGCYAGSRAYSSFSVTIASVVLGSLVLCLYIPFAFILFPRYALAQSYDSKLALQ